MTHTELCAILARIGGPSARGLAAIHGVPYSRSTRWLTGQTPIPEPVAAWWWALDGWREEHLPPRAW